MIKMKKTLKCIRIAPVVLLSIFLLGACGSSIPSPTETTDTFLKAVKEQDMDTMSTVYSGSELNLLKSWDESNGDSESTEGSKFEKVVEEQLLPKMLEFEYEISNEKIDGEKATVDVTIKTYKIGDAFNSFISEYMSQAMMLAFGNASNEELDALSATLISGKIADLTDKTYEKTTTVSLSMKDDKWMIDEIDMNSEVLDALTGGLVSSMKTMEGIFSEFDEKE